LACGATSLMYEGAPNFPEPDRFWRIVDKYGVTILYTATHGDPRLHEMGRRVAKEARSEFTAAAGTVGEPINPKRGFGTIK